MKRLRILPGAAGIIALTATLGFVDRRQEIEIDSFSRSNITLVKTINYMAAPDVVAKNRSDINPDSAAYLVKVRHGEIFAEVLIDAVTGRVLVS
jgi:hypothetical protein